MDHVTGLPPAPAAFFTRGEALARGETDRSLRSAVRSGQLVRLRHGAYALHEDVASYDEREHHLVVARAALAQQKGAVALAGVSAALQRGFAVFGHDLGLVHLARLDGGSSRRQAGVVHHVLSDTAHRVEVVDGVLTVGAADTVWQVALLSTLEGGVVTADSALHQDPKILDELRTVVGRSTHQPRSRTARLAIGLARKEAESPGESLTRVACFRHGVPAPDLQHVVVNEGGQLLGRTDFWWEDFEHLGEFDGQIKYGRLLKPGETSSLAVVKEKRREDRMRATGKGMSRFAWPEVLPGRAAARRMAELNHELEQSRRLYVTVWSGRS